MRERAVIILIIALALIGFGLGAKQWTAPVRAEAPAPDSVESPAAPAVIRLFFGHRLNDPGQLDCEQVHPVIRQLAPPAPLPRAALELLLAGPTSEERRRGFFTALDSRLKINYFSIVEGVARLELDEAPAGGSGACLASARRAQISATLKQFPGVARVDIIVKKSTIY